VKLLLLGADGQLGKQLRRALPALGQVVALTRRSTDYCGDLLDLPALAATIRSIQPDAVVNAAAYTAVDRAEDDPATAFAVNAAACEVMASETRRLGAWLVHYSTDYVYAGDGQLPRTEGDATHPLNVYGQSKLAGDQAVASNPRHLILRTSWVHDPAGENFLKSILKAAAVRDTLSVVDDQWGSPTAASLIASVTARILPGLEDHHAGVYHLAAEGFTNWRDYAALIVEEGLARGLPLRTAPARVLGIPSAQYPVRARRPANSRLDTSRVRKTFGLHLPAWQDGVRSAVAELAAQAGV
jgi:dTDP-4-dehydrorhamnose reductase